jgi:RNA ligase
MKKFEHYELLKQMVAERTVNVQKHPTLPLYIYKYSITCGFEKKWNPATLAARGLVLDENGIQYNSPFPKFFNIEELEGLGIELPNEPYVAYKKIDGSLIQAFFYKGDLIYTSSGSFDSIYAKMGKQIAIEKGYDKQMKSFANSWYQSDYKNGLSFIFEILF